MARQNFGAAQGHVGVERRARGGEDFVEDPTHREDRRTGIEARTRDLDLAHLSAGMAGALHDLNLKSPSGQFERADQPADSRPDDDHFLAAHVVSVPSRILLTYVSINHDTSN